jgi:hypothetical protein
LDLPPLSDDYKEIENAQNQINEYQPLADTPLYRLFPWGCFCLKFFKKENNRTTSDYTAILEDDAGIDKKLNDYIDKLST